MPPKKSLNKNSKIILESSESAKNSISNLFSKIKEKDSELKECSFCNEKVKSCLLKDHIATKCKLGTQKKRKSSEEEVVFLGRSNSQKSLNQKFQIEIKRECILPSCKSEPMESVDINFSLETNFLDKISKSGTNLEIRAELCTEINSCTNEEANESFEIKQRSVKRLKSEEKEENETKMEEKALKKQNEIITANLDKNNDLKSESMDISTQKTDNEIDKMAYSSDFDFYLINFTNAIQSVLAEETFACLLNQEDYEIIEKFSNLKSNK